jgi:hypothetical protein
MRSVIGLHPRFTLFGTSGCHLCEEAEALVAAAAGSLVGVKWHCVDIADEEADAPHDYRERIPVIRDEFTGAELHWPFDITEISALLASPTNPPAAPIESKT